MTFLSWRRHSDVLRALLGGACGAATNGKAVLAVVGGAGASRGQSVWGCGGHWGVGAITGPRGGNSGQQRGIWAGIAGFDGVLGSVMGNTAGQ